MTVAGWSAERDGATAIVASLVAGAPAWARRTPRERARRIAALRHVIAARADAIAGTLAAAYRRPAFEVLTQEIVPTLEMCRYLERRMPGWLSPRALRYRRPGFLRARPTLVREPLGLVAVITPANFAFSLPLMTAAYFALAGNVIALKPSPAEPSLTDLLASLLRLAGLSPEVVTVVAGGDEAGAALIAAPGVRKVVFFGRRESACQVLRACGLRGIPAIIEAGGGTAAIIAADADLQRTAAGIAWSAFYYGGRSCASTERILVERRVAEEFTQRLVRAVRALWADEGREAAGALSPVTAALVRDALDRGARYAAAHPRPTTERSGALPGVLVDVPPDAPILRHELFGPLVLVSPVERAEAAVEFLRGSDGTLGISIWTRNRRRARDLAAALDVGMIWINDASVGLPTLPWGARAGAARGALFSELTLHEATRWKWTLEAPTSGRRPWWPPYSAIRGRVARFLPRLYR